MKQLITIIITFLALGAVSLLWDVIWIRSNLLRMILVIILFISVLLIGYRIYNAFAKANQLENKK